jgi:putative CocE/NonD family hydrolase
MAVPQYVKGKVPNLNVGGWFDQEDFAGPLRIFSAAQSQPGNLNYLVVGPRNHGGWQNGIGRKLKDIDFGSNTAVYFREKVQASWFNYWLKDKGPLNLPKVLAFQTGSNEWKAYEEWPPKKGTTDRRLYLHALGEASFDPVTESGAFDSYVSDPSRPVPYRNRPIPETYGGAGWSTWLVDDQRFMDTRPDVAVWRTKPLTTDVVVSGDVVADLFASTTGTDCDWSVKLIDVYPDGEPSDPAMGGYELMVAADVLRGQYRESFEKPKPIVAGEVTEYRIDLLTHNHLFRKGHRIMVQVQSSWFPLIDRNPQTFVPNIFNAAESDFQVATQRIFRSREYPSSVILPVAP